MADPWLTLLKPHVWMKFRLSGAMPATVQLLEAGHRERDGATVLRSSGVLQIGPPGGGGAYESPMPILMFTCPSPLGVNVIGELIRYELTLVGDSGTIAHAAIRLVPRCPDADMMLCLRLCSG